VNSKPKVKVHQPKKITRGLKYTIQEGCVRHVDSGDFYDPIEQGIWFLDRVSAICLENCTRKQVSRWSQKPIYQYSLSGDLLCIFRSLTEATVAVTGTQKNKLIIKKVLQGKRKTAYGYWWTYGDVKI
jgi:hypothetical protein